MQSGGIYYTDHSHQVDPRDDTIDVNSDDKQLILHSLLLLHERHRNVTKVGEQEETQSVDVTGQSGSRGR